MEEKNIKIELASGVASLEEKIDGLKREGKPLEFVSLLERAMNLISVVILNFKNVNEEDLKNISTLLRLCNTTMNPNNSDSLAINSESLYTLVETLEEQFKNQKFILSDDIEEQSIRY